MINKSSGAQASFSEYYGASSSILTLNVNLELHRGNRTTSSYDYKGNTYTTTTGYYYYLNIGTWNSLSYATGQENPQIT